MRDWTLKPPLGPSAVIAHNAEKHAHEAVHLVAGNPSRMTQVEVRSTLGEVLLGQGRPHEALEDLRPIAVGKYAAYNELRWDTALAYVCSGENDWQEQRISTKDYDKVIGHAIALLDQISELEADRETQPFTKATHALDARRPSRVCVWAEYQPGWQAPHGARGTTVEYVPNPPKFELKGGQPSYASSPPCEWEGVDFSVTDASGKDVSGVQLHVWGGGVDQRVEVQPRAKPDHVRLTDAPQATHDYYFAQLEDGYLAPVSFVYAIETFASLRDGTCPKNAISLNFVQLLQK